MSPEADYSTIDIFLAGARAVQRAVADPLVSRHWDSPSILEGQAVSGLVGHLCRGGVWVVGEYLQPDEPPLPLTFESAGAYFAQVAEQLGPVDHAAIRDRGAQIAAAGQASLIEELEHRLEDLASDLETGDPDRRLTVIGGAVMRLDDYLRTRVVEQVVHLDDLARSVGAEWTAPASCITTAMEVGIDVGLRRFGSSAMIGALFRDFGAGVLPVL